VVTHKIFLVAMLARVDYTWIDIGPNVDQGWKT